MGKSESSTIAGVLSTNSAEVGEALRRHRGEIGVSQRQLSAYLGVCEATLRRWERRGCCGNRDAGVKISRFLHGDFDRELRSVNMLPAGMARRLTSFCRHELSFLHILVQLRNMGRRDRRKLECLASRLNAVVNECLEALLRRRN
jgi:hypothetical protein